MKKNKISDCIFNTLLVLTGIFLLCSAIYSVWVIHYNRLLDKEGEYVIATIICKKYYTAEYDIEYDGIYYRDWINLSKSAYRRIQVGEKFYARILPDRLKYYREGGLGVSSCFKLILCPLPSAYQDIEKEQERIENMYGSQSVW